MNNVNQVSSPSLDQDMTEAGLNQEPETAESFNRTKTGRIEIPVPFPFPPPTVATEVDRELKEAEAKDGVIVTREVVRAGKELAKAQEQLAELSKNAEVVAQLEKAGVEIDPDAIVNVQSEFEKLVEQVGWRSSTSLFEPRDPDLKAFKKQVIAAFKHLGLDTKQFFGV